MSWVLTSVSLVWTFARKARLSEICASQKKKKKPLLYGPIRKKAPFRLTSQKKNTLWSDQLEKGITFGGQMRKRQPLRVNQSEDVLG